MGSPAVRERTNLDPLRFILILYFSQRKRNGRLTIFHHTVSQLLYDTNYESNFLFSIIIITSITKVINLLNLWIKKSWNCFDNVSKSPWQYRVSVSILMSGVLEGKKHSSVLSSELKSLPKLLTKRDDLFLHFVTN